MRYGTQYGDPSEEVQAVVFAKACRRRHKLSLGNAGTAACLASRRTALAGLYSYGGHHRVGGGSNGWQGHDAVSASSGFMPLKQDHAGASAAAGGAGSPGAGSDARAQRRHGCASGFVVGTSTSTVRRSVPLPYSLGGAPVVPPRTSDHGEGQELPVRSEGAPSVADNAGNDADTTQVRRECGLVGGMEWIPHVRVLLSGAGLSVEGAFASKRASMPGVPARVGGCSGSDRTGTSHTHPTAHAAASTSSPLVRASQLRQQLESQGGVTPTESATVNSDVLRRLSALEEQGRVRDERIESVLRLIKQQTAPAPHTAQTHGLRSGSGEGGDSHDAASGPAETNNGQAWGGEKLDRASTVRDARLQQEVCVHVCWCLWLLCACAHRACAGAGPGQLEAARRYLRGVESSMDDADAALEFASHRFEAQAHTPRAASPPRASHLGVEEEESDSDGIDPSIKRMMLAPVEQRDYRYSSLGVRQPAASMAPDEPRRPVRVESWSENLTSTTAGARARARTSATSLELRSSDLLANWRRVQSRTGRPVVAYAGGGATTRASAGGHASGGHASRVPTLAQFKATTGVGGASGATQAYARRSFAHETTRAARLRTHLR